jgi:Ca-activated chloride channel family protein
MKPEVTFIPLRDAVAFDSVTNLDVIVRITTPQIKTTKPRPTLNLGLVVDRSGSMQGKKIEHARKAACYAVEQLSSRDRISITVYDDHVDVIVPSTLATNKQSILEKIKRIAPGGMTALHDGWMEGASQVSQHLQPEQLNRVILLSDGLANVGETNPDVIGSNVHGLSKHGVSTSTMGVGDDFNEDLMEAISRSGDGNYYYIQNPDQLEGIFAHELQGIMATVGQRVSLGIKTTAHVTLVDVFNDLEKTEFGNYKLPNLIAGNYIDVVLRLKIEPLEQSEPLADFRLAYDDSETATRKVSHYSLQLPVVNSSQLADFPFNNEVRERVTQLMASRAREEAVRSLDRGDMVGTSAKLQSFKEEILISGVPMSPSIKREIEELDDLVSELEAGKHKTMRKNAQYQTYQRRMNRQDK